MILLAFLVFSSPGGALLTFSLYIGIAFLVTGIFVIFRGISLRKVSSNWGWSVFEGFLDLFLGYVMLSNPLVTAEVFPFIFGFWATFYGIFLIIDSLSGTNNKTAKIISGILIIIFGNIIMFNPLFAGLTLAIWAGVLLLVAGIHNVIISFSLK